MGTKKKRVYRYNVYKNGKLFMENVTAGVLVDVLEIPTNVPAHYSLNGNIYRGIWTFECISGLQEEENDRSFKEKYGIDPEAYDRAMHEFKEKGGRHMKLRFVPTIGI